MARIDHVVESHATGERIVFHTTAAETRGMLLGADLFLTPGAAVAAEHVPLQEERS
jgi:hypothetical protein